MPTPSWIDVMVATTWEQDMIVRHFEVRHQMTSPTAIGRCPPFDFGLVGRVAPQRWGRTVGGVWPAARRFVKLVSADNVRLARSGEGHMVASCRWLGRRPEGPGAETIGKDFTPFRIPVSVRDTEGGVGPGGRAGEGPWGCFSSIS